jgi:hypothetical protein
MSTRGIESPEFARLWKVESETSTDSSLQFGKGSKYTWFPPEKIGFKQTYLLTG